MLGGEAGTVTRRTWFVDESLNEAMARDGFAVLPQRLDRSGVERLLSLYRGVLAEVGTDGSGRFRPSMTITRPELRARLWDGVRAIVGDQVAEWFRPGTTDVLGGSFVAKPSGPDGSRFPHQDPTIFDERTCISLSLWVPLCDSTLDNGTLRMLPGSHRMGNHVRPPDVESFDDEVRQVALEESVPYELAPGEVLAIDGAVVHHSPPNRSDEERVALIAALRPAGAPMYHVRSDGGADHGVAELYDVGPEMYRSGNLVSPTVDPARLAMRVPYRPATLADLAASRATAR